MVSLAIPNPSSRQSNVPYITIRHRVKDYDAWETQFNATERPGRLQAAKRVTSFAARTTQKR